MFGLRPEERLKLDNAIQTAITALDRLQSHEVRCTERYSDLNATIKELRKFQEDSAKERNASIRRIFWMIIAVVVSLVSLILKDVVSRGLQT